VNRSALDQSRRRFVATAAGTVISSFLPGCCRLHPHPLPSCALASPLVAPSQHALAIDVHSHVFNGTDLQVQKFIELNVSLPYDSDLKKIFGEVIQGLTWTLAPTACEEYEALGSLASCGQVSARDVRISHHREQGYERGRREIRAAPVFRQYNTPEAKTRRESSSVAAEKRTQYLDLIGSLLDAPTLDGFHAARASFAERRDLNVSVQDVLSMLRFILQGFNYRYISTLDYLDIYNPSGFAGRSLDLVIANLVDYDWPLAGGSATRSPFRDQISVMERLSIFMHGRIHAFVPFDPMRQVAIAAGIAPSEGKDSHLTFEEIKDAVMNRGFLGVKLYPVMGFKPTGNAALPADAWAQPWLPEWMSKPITIGGISRSFGEWMDEALESLYTWAEANGVPITSHTDPSQGPAFDFNGYTISDAWHEVFQHHKDLRLNFGHAGDPTAYLSTFTGSSGDPLYPPSAQTVIFDYMCGPGSAERYHYGDLSYPEGALANPTDYIQLLKGFFNTPVAPGGVGPQDRFMYGTDWLMVLMERNADDCLKIAEDAFNAIDATVPQQTPSFSDRFFAFNAIRWLGLSPGGSSWNRLTAFYRKNGIDTDVNPPTWMNKVRALNTG